MLAIRFRRHFCFGDAEAKRRQDAAARQDASALPRVASEDESH